MEFVMNFIVVHLLLGFGGGLVCLFVLFRGRRWRPFRFGGRNPLSIGEKKQWLFWYGFAFAFEYLTSFWFGHKLYEELAMSAIEAAALTTGLFLADRIKMMAEPESYWRNEDEPRRDDAPRQGPAVEPPSPASSVEPVKEPKAPPASEAPASDKSWTARQAADAGETLRDVTEGLKSGAAEVAGAAKEGVENVVHTVQDALHEREAERKTKEREQLDAEEAKRNKVRKDFDDLTRGH